MENAMDLKVVLKHLVNGTLGENLCVICLAPLKEMYENIFTKVCKEDKEYCIADVLNEVCDVQFLKSDNFNVCIDCFMTASVAYRFYLLSKRSNEILNIYTDEIIRNLNDVELCEDQKPITLGLTLPYMVLETKTYDFDLQGILVRNTEHCNVDVGELDVVKEEKGDEDIVVVVKENGEQLFYRVENGDMSLLNEDERQGYKIEDDIKTRKYRKSKKKELKASPMATAVNGTQSKIRKKRSPLTQKRCSRCPVKYMFIAKLKEHMKLQHNVDLFVCKVCKAITEDELEYHSHLKTHTNVHQCDICKRVFKRRESIINHLQLHEKMNKIRQSDGAHVCEVCGVMLENETSLNEHYDGKHYKKFTCFYCGRMYKGEISFEMHIKKHEEHSTGQQWSEGRPLKSAKAAEPTKKSEIKKKKCMCITCGRYFVDERALMWHQRLHNNDRPYSCNECGRAFVSVNRRNQHTLCAHSAPTRRCPLCPALFHLRSMVNTHIKKVHLKEHKRRNRMSKYENVSWRTEPVPIQELSVAVQNDVLKKMQTARNDESKWNLETGLQESRAISSAIL